MHRFTRASLIAATLLGASFAHAAGEDEAKKNLETFIGKPVVEKINAVPYGGLYEVLLNNGQLIYTDAKASFIIDGHIIDTATRKDITQARLNELDTIDFATLKLDNAIKTVRGNGKRVIATFEDPNCGYCKKLAKELRGVDDLTIYTFLLPVLGPDSLAKSKSIWCAKDRSAAWNNWMVDNKAPEGDGKCDTSAIDANAEFGRKLRINGTPTIFLADGRRIGGYVPAAELVKSIDNPPPRAKP